MIGTRAGSPPGYRIGVDENGLGSRLGPMITTAVLARVTPAGERWLETGGLTGMGGDLQDSKRVASHADSRLGEAWARVVGAPLVGAPVVGARVAGAGEPAPGDEPDTPAALFARLSLEGEGALAARCPKAARPQCWGVEGERFLASDAQVERVRGRFAALAEAGVVVTRTLTSVACTAHLNDERAAGRSRFVVDLHAMERLVLALREIADAEVVAICGKVGGIGDYPRFFGPLAGRLHAVLAAERSHSAYHFPGLGALHFVMDADAQDPLVMLASLVGKYVRELFMARVGRFSADAGAPPSELPSGYHDPRTDRFVVATAGTRAQRQLPVACFERDR